MARAQPKRLRDYLKGRDQPPDFQSLPKFYVQRHFFNPFTLAIGLVVILALGSFLSRFCFVLLTTLGAFLGWLYVHTRTVAEGLFARRTLANDLLHEGTNARIDVVLSNASSYTASGLMIEETFGPSRDPRVLLCPDSDISGRTQIHLSYERVCDGGMGRHKIGPMQIKVTDPLGIFEFRVPIDDVLEVEVLPRIEALPALPVRGSPGSSNYGNFDAATRGLSVNFSGVRPYALGDPLKHVAWRLSSKGQGLLVKEFEKAVNSEVSVFLNLDRYLLTGLKSHSTWELAKNAALAILSQQCDAGNTVQFHCAAFSIGPGRGPEHFLMMATRISRLDPTQSQPAPDPLGFLKEKLESIPRSSTVFYIAPYHEYEHSHSFPIIGRLAVEGYQVFCVYVDTNSFWPHVIESVNAAQQGSLLPALGFDEASRRLRLKGVTVFVARDQDDVARVFSGRASGGAR